MRTAVLTGIIHVLLGHVVFATSLGRSPSLDIFAVTQGLRSYQGILDNLGNKGSKAPGTAAGLLVASPNTANPDCEFRVSP